jgi:putative heme-binding domain-containing protein
LLADLLPLDDMEQCAVKSFPAAWMDRLRRELRGKDRERVVALVHTRQLSALAEDLDRIGNSEAEPANLRVAALGALAGLRPGLTNPSFRFLLRLLAPATEADLRQSAAQVLGRARLSDAQLLALAGDHLGRADPLILPSLLDAFRAVRSDEIGRALVAGLIQSPHAEVGISAARIPDLLRNFSPEVRAAARPLFERIEKEKASRAERLRSLEPLLAGGDPHRGREVFFGKKAGCASCHTIMTDGADVGPDLTGVGAIRTGLDLLEAIVFPSASFVPGHEVYRVETAREVYTGVLGPSTPDAIVVITGPRDRIRIPRKDVVSSRPSTVSLMPDGFTENLTRAELSDLLAFLQSQKYRELRAGVQ